MKNTPKILALITLFIVIIMITSTVYADNSVENAGNSIQSSINSISDDDVDWDNIDYGCPDQGDNCSGVAVEVDDTEYAGKVHTLTKAQYKEMWKRITKWQAKEKTDRLPNYVTITDMKVGVSKVTKAQYLDMKKRWNAWKKAHNGKEPTTIGIEGPVGGSTPSSSGPIQKALMDAVGSFKSFSGFYKLCKNRDYAYYKNNKYSRSLAIKRLKAKSGLNCVDVSQLGYALAKEMGYQVKFQETYCPKSKVGHVLLKIRGKEFSSWTIVDLAACLSSGMAIGRYWGIPPHDAVHNWVE